MIAPTKMLLFFFRLAVLGKLNNFVKEWISEISELKVGSVECLPSKIYDLCCIMESFSLMVTINSETPKLSMVLP